jgi:hypothetical protein
MGVKSKCMLANAMNSAMADAHHPDLCLRNACAQLVACRHLIAGKLERSAFDIDRRKLAVVGWFEMRIDATSDLRCRGRGAISAIRDHLANPLARAQAPKNAALAESVP